MYKLKTALMSLIASVMTILTSGVTKVLAEEGRDTGTQTITGDTTVAFTNAKSGTIPTGINIGNTLTYAVMALIAISIITIVVMNKHKEAFTNE